MLKMEATSSTAEKQPEVAHGTIYCTSIHNPRPRSPLFLLTGHATGSKIWTTHENLAAREPPNHHPSPSPDPLWIPLSIHPSIMAHGLLEWQGNTQEYHPLCLEITPHRHRWVTREGGSWLPRMLTQSSHPILISCVMPVLEQLKSESAFLYLVFFIIFYTQFFHNLTFTYYSIVITIHLSNLPFPLIHWWYNHEVHTQESLRP